METNIISNNQNLSVTDLLNELYTTERPFLSNTDIYNHIKRNTEDFNLNLLEHLINDIMFFLLENAGITTNESSFVNIRRMYGVVTLRDVESLEDVERVKIGSIIDMFYAILKSYKTEDEYKKYISVRGLTHIKRYVAIAEGVYLEKLNEVELSKKEYAEKQPLTFEELFKPAYRGELDKLFDRLRLNGFVDKDKNWIIKNGTSEPARLYHYLKGKNVLSDVKFAPAIKCFYNKFGCEVVEKKNGNPRATTRRNAKEAENSVTWSDFEKFLSNWVNSR